MSSSNQVGQKLKFRIVDISGEDPEYPATELLSQSPQSKGWQSPRFCDWPQYITIQFVSPVMLKQLQFLSHQCKIASKVELYTALPDLKSQVPTLELKFKKLGYLSLDPNERSGYQSRELKTVYVECPCLYLKVVFQKCHINKYNLFNQVGLIAIGCFGEPIAKDKENNMKMDANPKYDKLEYETQFDTSTLDRLKELEDAKARAIKDENFDEAKRIKEAIERLKHIGAQLQALEERKIIAIQNEDFDSAKVIKQEIERLRDAVAPNNLLRKYKDDQDDEPVQQPQRQQPRQERQQKVTYDIPTRQNDDDRPIKGNRAPPKEYDDAPEEFKQEESPHDELPINRKKKATEPSTASNKQLFKNKQAADDDDRPLPALQSKNQQPTEYPEDGNDGGNAGSEAEFLSNENLKLAEPLIPIISEDIARKIFSKTWNLREDGLRILEQEAGLEGRSKIVNYSDTGAAFIALMGVVSHTIQDKIGQVSQRSMSLLQKILSKEPKSVSSRGELNSYIDVVILGLLDKIGDNNAKVRQQAENAFMAMANSPLVSCTYCVQALVKNPSGSNTKLKNINSTKHVIARLGLLRQIIQEYKIGNQNVPYSNVITYVIDKLENSNADIRQASFNIVVDIYGIMGEKIRGDLANVRPQHMEMLQKEFDNISGGGGGGKQNYDYGQKETVITTNINPQGAGKKGGAPTTQAKGGNTKTAQGNKGPQSGDANANPGAVCEFCGRQDRNLLDPGKMDIHLWKECPMLTTCQNCAQVVEISTLNHHLLDECENRKVMRKCPRCKEAIKMEEYKLHTDEMSCNPLLPAEEANRCPLCHQDIAPGEMGWKRHLLTEGCPNNDRTF